MIDQSQWIWYGHAGHLCVADFCRFHLATQVGKFMISTVGDYHLPGNPQRQLLGAGENSFYETYVFRVVGESKCSDPTCDCGVPKIDFGEIEGIRCATAGQARKNHLRMCRKYAKK